MKTWWLQAGKPWMMENLTWVALIIACAVALFFCWQHEQRVMQALPLVFFGFPILHAIVQIIRNPVKEETKMQQLMAGTVDSLKIEAVAGEDFVLHLKHLIEKHLGHSVVITPAPVVSTPVMHGTTEGAGSVPQPIPQA